MPPPAEGETSFVPVDPYALARNEARASQLKRFYKDVAILPREGGFVLMLDGREARTPARAPLRLPALAAAELLAAEWTGQGEVIEPSTMPATRLVNSVIDGVAQSMEAVTAEIVRYAGTDLLCYRAEQPAELVARQAEAWDPVLAWAREAWQARLALGEGVMHVAQPPEAIEALGRAVAIGVGEGAGAPFRLGALHVMTTLTGSALLGLAVLHGHSAADEAWAKAHVDEDFQIARWGEDAEAAVRRDRRWHDMRAAAELVRRLGPVSSDFLNAS